MSTALPSSVEAVTVPEVMRALRLSRSKVYDLLRTGRLQSFTVDRSRRIPLDSLRTFIQHRTEEAA